MTDDVENLGSFVGDEVLEVLFGGYFALDSDFGFIAVLRVDRRTFRADSSLCSSDRKSTGILASFCLFSSKMGSLKRTPMSRSLSMRIGCVMELAW